MKLQTLGCLASLWIFLSGLAAAQAVDPAKEAASQAPASSSGQDVEPDKARAYYHFALGHFYQERSSLFNRTDLLNQAIEELKLAQQYDPDSTFLSLELADLYAATGRWRNALQEAENAVQRNPQDSTARKFLGRLYLRVLTGGRSRQVPEELRQRAVQQFEEILERDPTDIGSYLVLAQLYRAMSENAKAEETLKKAVALQPDSSDANTNLALLYVDVGDYRAAIELLEKVTVDSSDPRLLTTLAYSYEQVRDFSSAAGAYSRALELEPNNLAYRKALGQSYLQSRQYDKALDQFQIVIRANPQDGEAYLRLGQVYRAQHRYALARENLDKALELFPDNLDIQYNRALLAEAEGKIPEAIAIIENILDSTAANDSSTYTPQELSNRGIFLEKVGFLHRDRGDFAAAEETFRRMLALGGEVAIRGEVHLIGTYRENRQYDRALEASEKAVQAYPDSQAVATEHASLLASMGDVAGAVALLQPFLKSTQGDRGIWLVLAQIHLRAKQFEQAREAVSHAKELSQSKEETEYIHFLYGSIWERQKQFGRAEEEFRKALDLNPNSAMTLNYLGYMLADLGIRLKESVSYIQRALQIEPNSGAYLDSLGWAYYKQDRLDLAEQYLRKAVERLPADPTIRDHMGDLYYRSGRIREAHLEWEAARGEWIRLPKNEVDGEELAKVEKKIKNVLVKLAQEGKESSP